MKLVEMPLFKKQKLQGDDASTPDINEAWVGGKAPKKAKKKAK